MSRIMKLLHPPLNELGLHEERPIEKPTSVMDVLAKAGVGSMVISAAVTPPWAVGQTGTPDLVAVRTVANQPFVKPKYTEALEKNDAFLAQLFGDADTVAAANGFEPKGIGNDYRGSLFEGDLGHLQRSMHMYGSQDSNAEGPLYIPDGFRYLGAMNTPNGRENAGHSFYYRKLGELKNVVLRVFHVKDFAIDRTDVNATGSIRIGGIGGPGGAPFPNTTPIFRGERRDYRHAHLEILEGASNANSAPRIPFYVAFPTPSE